MTVLKALLACLVLVVLLGLGFLAYAWRSEMPPLEARAAPSFEKSLVERGETLAAIGNCAVCHTAEGGAFLAGGRPIETPFGAIHASNLTPDRETGIGLWSEAAFQRAMREGVDRGGRHLYPAFPYDHFTAQLPS